MDKLEQYIASHRQSYFGTGVNNRRYSCPECKDTGWIMVAQAGREVARQCRCFAARRSLELMECSGISEGFRGKGFEEFDTKGNPQLIKAKNKAVRYAENFGLIEHERNNSIMFRGQVGSGKPHLGTAICKSLIDTGVAVIYMAYRSAITKIKQYAMDAAAYKKQMELYMRARVLYIDDLLKGRLTEADINIMYEIVNYRYMNKLPVIISTEKSLDELLVFDEAVGSRLVEMCRGNIVYLQGKELNYRIYGQRGGLDGTGTGRCDTGNGKGIS